MKIMKISLVLSIIALFAISCQENDRMTYRDKAALYFPEYTVEDSLNFSFTTTIYDEDTIYLNVRILGIPFAEDKTFNLEVAEDSGTAIRGTHFEIEDEYTFLANATSVAIPVYVKNSANLQSEFVHFNLEIVPNETFDIAFTDKNLMRIYLTDQLIKPSYWDSLLQLYMGEYSLVKHKQFVLMYGHDFPQGGTNQYSYYMRAGRALSQYYAMNPTVDENGKPIAPWAPF